MDLCRWTMWIPYDVSSRNRHCTTGTSHDTNHPQSHKLRIERHHKIKYIAVPISKYCDGSGRTTHSRANEMLRNSNGAMKTTVDSAVRPRCSRDWIISAPHKSIGNPAGDSFRNTPVTCNNREIIISHKRSSFFRSCSRCLCCLRCHLCFINHTSCMVFDITWT